MKIKKISAMLLCTTALCATSSFAQNLAPAFLEGEDLVPHVTKLFEGKWFSTKIFHCQIRAERNEPSSLLIEANKHRVAVNGVIVPEGGFMKLVVNIGSTIDFELDANGEFGITNESSNLMNIRCD